MTARFAPMVVVLAAAGCGGAKAPSVASLGTSTTTRTTTESATASFAAFVGCMTAHGISASTGPGGRGVSISGDIAQS